MIILQFAKLPPPIGGVTIHVQRLLSKLTAFDTEVLDYSKTKNPLIIFRKIKKSKIVHIHLSNKKVRYALVILLKIFRKTCIVTFHGKYDFNNFYDRTVLKSANYSILLNNFSFRNAEKHNPNRIKLIGAFIPPIEKNITPLDFEINTNIEKFLKEDYEFIFSTNASSFVLDSNGKEIYMGTELLTFFRLHPKYALLFSDPSKSYSKYFKENEITIPINVYLISENHNFVHIIRNSNALIRATTMDGDSLSVKEALYYKIPVYATDVVDRTNEVVLFSDFNDFENKIKDLNNIQIKNVVIDNSIEIIELYNHILKK
tara:strand:+ start:1835 stop:2782 length:948 start_codon:yes stop_codon:yes gene_type:complete